MNKQGRLGLLFLLVLGVTVAPSPWQVRAASGPTSALARVYEPVVVRGEQLPLFANTPTSQLFAYAYQGGVWHQIPAQVDEISAAGRYIEAETPAVLDANDEVVFMVKDVGEAANGAVPSVGGQPLSAWWYELQIHDPTSAATTGWVYLLHSSTLTPISTDYVSFDDAMSRLAGVSYDLHFATPSPDVRPAWVDELRLGEGGNRGPDIIDRAPKTRACPFVPNCTTPLTEDMLGTFPQNYLIKDGPVRVIVRDGRVRAYGSMVSWTVIVPRLATFPNGFASLQSFSDFNANVSGAKLYNAATPQTGVTIDGTPESIPATPFSEWWQVNTPKGTLIQAGNFAPIGGTRTNLYIDNSAAPDNSEPGHYGATGFTVVDPNAEFTFDFNFYFLPSGQSKIGDKYRDYFAKPHTITSQFFDNLHEQVHLPLIAR